jgi:hypothetical protein
MRTSRQRFCGVNRSLVATSVNSGRDNAEVLDRRVAIKAHSIIRGAS